MAAIVSQCFKSMQKRVQNRSIEKISITHLLKCDLNFFLRCWNIDTIDGNFVFFLRRLKSGCVRGFLFV